MFSKAVKIFTINGFDIKLDPSWLLIATLITWSLAQFFPTVLPFQSSATYLAMAFFAMLCFFASLLLHELAHSVVARHFGVPIRGITLFLFGGVAELEAEPKSARVEFLIAIAGPLMSLFLALWFWALSGLSTLLFDAPALTQVLSYLGAINLILALFNLVPAFPLDGGRVLRAYLWHRSGDVLQATRTAARSGSVVGYILMTLGIFGLFQGAFISGLWQIMIGIFVLVAARTSYENQLIKTVIGTRPVSAVMRKDPVTVGPDVTLTQFVDRFILGQGLSFVPVVEDGVLLGHIDRTVIAEMDRDNWASTRVGDVFAGLDPAIMISPETPVQELLDLVVKTGRRKFLVTRDHDLVGVVSLADLTGYLKSNELNEELQFGSR